MLDIIKSWGGFEEFIASMHKTGTVTVKHNVHLTDRSGIKRQIDVLVIHKEGFYEHKILIECKFWKKRIPREKIDSMATAVRELGASKGVFFTTKGFQSGAEQSAKAHGIEAFIVRETVTNEWAAPGQIIDFYIHYIQPTIMSANLQLYPTKNIEPLNLVLGDISSETPITAEHQVESTLESQLMKVLIGGFRDWVSKQTFIINNGEECTRYFKFNINYEPPKPIEITRTKQLILGGTIEAAAKIIQTRFRYDRSLDYNFAVVVENCITNSKWFATQLKSNDKTSIKEYSLPKPDISSIKNGSVLKVSLKGLFDPIELDGLKEIDYKERPL